MINIAFDLDDVICDLSPYLEEVVIRKYSRHVCANLESLMGRRKEYYIKIPEIPDEEINELVDYEIENNYNYIPIILSSYITLKELLANNHIDKIRIFTARGEHQKEATQIWMEKYFHPEQFEINMLGTDKKGVFLRKQNIEIYVDDKAKTVNDVTNCVPKVYLVSKKWNEDESLDDDIYRISNISEIREINDLVKPGHILNVKGDLL